MTTRKIVFIILGIIAFIVLAVLLTVSVIAGFVFYSIGNSQAAETAKTFLRNSEKLKADIGEVKDFGSFVTGSVNIANDNGSATINIKVIGERETVNASVNLVFLHGQDWRVVSASYVDKKGQTISLQDPYDTRIIIPPPRLIAAA